MPLAGRAGRHVRPRLDAGRLAPATGDGDAERNVPLRPRRRLRERDLDVGGDVRAARPHAHRLRDQVVAEEGREDVGEAAEVEGRGPEAAAAQAGVAEAVVELARLALREHLVRLDRLLEALLGIGRLRDVGVELARQPAKRLLDLRLAGVAVDAEHLVVVALVAMWSIAPRPKPASSRRRCPRRSRESSRAAARTDRIAIS